MATVILYIAASLDGYIADEDGGVAWLETFSGSYEDGEPGSSYEEFFASVDCLVMGATTYEQVLTFGEWPYGDRRTVVTTHRELPQATEDVEFYAGDLPALVSELDDAHERIWLVGGATLARAFLRDGLLDELRLSLIPVLLGNGVSLFEEDGPERSLHLVDTRAFDNGIVELTYAIRTSQP